MIFFSEPDPSSDSITIPATILQPVIQWYNQSLLKKGWQNASFYTLPHKEKQFVYQVFLLNERSLHETTKETAAHRF